MTNIGVTIDYKWKNDVLGIWTRDRRMEGLDESTELWRPKRSQVSLRGEKQRKKESDNGQRFFWKKSPWVRWPFGGLLTGTNVKRQFFSRSPFSLWQWLKLHRINIQRSTWGLCMCRGRQNSDQGFLGSVGGSERAREREREREREGSLKNEFDNLHFEKTVEKCAVCVCFKLARV